MNPSAPTLELIVNGRRSSLAVDRRTPLLYVLRNDLECNGPKYGCGLGQCGACAVLIGDLAVRACIVPVEVAVGKAVTTLEGLGTPESPGLVQQAFIDAQAAQCGYCLSGMIITTHALLLRNPAPSEGEIREELRFNLCRCGTHVEILDAVRRAASAWRKQSPADSP